MKNTWFGGQYREFQVPRPQAGSRIDHLVFLNARLASVRELELAEGRRQLEGSRARRSGRWPPRAYPPGSVYPTADLSDSPRALGGHLPGGAGVDADRIVLGSQWFSGIDHLIGTTASCVVDHADRSVLVVRET